MTNKSKWYVLHVKPRTEKKCATWLAHYHCWHHLPLWIKEKKVQRRKVRTEMVLFPGYVFARLNSTERTLIAKSNLVVHFIDVIRPREMIHQLREIRDAGKKGPVTPVERFVSNDYIRVKTGPFVGTTGYVKEVSRNGKTIVINIDILGMAVAFNVKAAECERLPPPET